MHATLCSPAQLASDRDRNREQILENKTVTQPNCRDQDRDRGRNFGMLCPSWPALMGHTFPGNLSVYLLVVIAVVT